MKFSIRDLMLVTVIVAVCAGWWVDRSRVALRVHEAAEAAKSMEAESAVLLRRLARLEQENLQIRLALAESPNSSAAALNPPKD